jgi:hypothetical protein
LPKRASASSISNTAPARSASAKIMSRFFSVSPMYLLTTEARSTWKTVVRSSAANASAAFAAAAPAAPARSTAPRVPARASDATDFNAALWSLTTPSLR